MFVRFYVTAKCVKPFNRIISKAQFHTHKINNFILVFFNSSSVCNTAIHHFNPFQPSFWFSKFTMHKLLRGLDLFKQFQHLLKKNLVKDSNTWYKEYVRRSQCLKKIIEIYPSQTYSNGSMNGVDL